MRLFGLMSAAMTAVVLASCSQMQDGAGQATADGEAESAPLNGPNWITWGGDLGNQRYAPLDQIDASNAAQLQVVWRRPGLEVDGRPNSNWKATPLYVDGTLYIPDGGTQIVAIDPGTGATKWTFTPDPYRKEIDRGFSGSTRAVSYWTDGTEERLLLNSIDGRLISVDAKTGLADPAFGENGQIDLNKGVLPPDDPRAADPQDMNSTAPGIVVGDVIVIQMIGDDTIGRKGGTPGYVRGFDVRTGEKLWTFHTIPRPGEFGNDTWGNDSWDDFGAASVWTMMAADPELGYVYLPVESPTNNFWAGDRPGDGLFGESLVCVDAATGERVWHFQILHHGVWDYDLPSAPILHDVVKDGKTIKAVTQLTKQGMSFVFDRETGEPVWPIEERPVNTALQVPGEQLSETQPFPTKPAPYANLGFHEEDVLDLTPELHAQATEFLSAYTKAPEMYMPPTLISATNKGTIVYPNYGGGSNWNGGAVDPETNTMFVPTRNTYMALGLTPSNQEDYEWDYRAVSGGVLRLDNGLPVNKPPWALVTATDMNDGEHAWSRSIGGAPDFVRELPELQGLDLDFDSMGQISVRPSPLVTKSLMFLASSGNIGGDPGDNLFWAYDKATGDIVAKIELPAKTSGAPMTYMHDGRQYIVVALSERGYAAELVALALPREGEVAAAAADAPDPANADDVEMGSTDKTGITATAEALAAGRQAYAQSCALCHGGDGRGVPGGSAPSLQALASLDEIRAIVANGSAEMPPMNGILTPEQIDAVSRYVALGLPASQ